MPGVLPTWVAKLPLPPVAPVFGGGTPRGCSGWGWGSHACFAEHLLAVTGIQLVHKAKLLEVFIVFPSDFFFYPSNFGHVFDSFYLLSHHSSSCTGATPAIPIPRAGLSNHRLKINPVKEVLGFFFFRITNCFSCCVFAFLHKMAIL